MAGHSSGSIGILTAGIGFGAAVGIVFGTLMLAPNLPAADGEGASASRASRERIELTEERDTAQAQNDAADEAFAAVMNDLVSERLTGHTVMLISTSTADDTEVDGVSSLLEAAGATDGGHIALSESFFSSDGADQLKSIVATTLPAGAQLSEDDLSPGTHAGDALAPVLFADSETGEAKATMDDRELLLQSLIDAGYLTTQGTLIPADAVVIVSGEEDGGSESTSFFSRELANFARALGESGTTVVGAGYYAASSTGPLGLLRGGQGSSQIATIDSIDHTWSQASLILATQEALAGEVGAYGAAGNAEAAVPEILE